MPPTETSANISLTVQQKADLLAWSLIAAICIATFLYFSTAFTGQNLHVWGDEVIYRIDAMRDNFSDVAYPGYLFLWLASLLPKTDGVFPETIRAWNAGLLALAVPFIYSTCRLYTARKWSILIAALSVAGPFSTYVAYFMPDVMYFCGFCIFAWFCLRFETMKPIRYGMFAGILTACLSMIKPHGVFILTAFIATQMLCATLMHSTDSARNAAKVVIGASIAFLTFRGLLGWHFAGLNGLNLLGDYSEKLKWEGDTFFNIARLFLISLGGHAVAIALLTGPINIALFVPLNTVDQLAYPKQTRLRIFAGCMLAIMLAITILFTTKLAEGGHASETARMHMRYYNLFFPVAYLVLATQIQNMRRSNRWVWAVAAILVAGIISTQFGSLHYFVPLDLDAPELCGIVRYPTILGIFAFLVGLAVVSFPFRPRYSAIIYLCIALPALILTSTIVVTNDIKFRSQDDIGDAAGKQISRFIGSNSYGMGLFGDVTPICQVMFYAGNPTSFLYPLAEGMPVPGVIAPKKVIYGGLFPKGKKSSPEMHWAVVFGKRDVPSNFKEVLSGNDWRLFNII